MRTTPRLLWRVLGDRRSIGAMTRVLALQLILYLLPFALYACWHALSRGNPLTGAAWRLREVVLLTIAGLVLSVGLFSVVSNNAGAKLFGRNTQAQQQGRP